MADCACDDDTIARMSELVLSQNGVQSIDLIKTRLFGAKIYVDIEIGVACNLSLIESHDIAQTTHDQLEKEFKNVKHCMIHVNPVDLA